MQSRDVIGKRIVGIEQERFWDVTTASWAASITAILLEGGSRILLSAHESEDAPYVEARLSKKKGGGHA